MLSHDDLSEVVRDMAGHKSGPAPDDPPYLRSCVKCGAPLAVPDEAGDARS